MNAALDGNQQDLGDLSNAANISKAALNHATRVDIYINLYLYSILEQKQICIDSSPCDEAIGCWVLDNGQHVTFCTVTVVIKSSSF